jgi:hypothetical protein
MKKYVVVLEHRDFVVKAASVDLDPMTNTLKFKNTEGVLIAEFFARSVLCWYEEKAVVE